MGSSIEGAGDDVLQEALRLNGIVKTFPGVMALCDMSFDLQPGEIHAICGENGAGKSTLMKVVTGVYPPDSGTLSLFGEETQIRDPIDALNKGIAIIYQETSLFEEMTVLENLFLGRELTKKVGLFPVLDYKRMEEHTASIFERLKVSISTDEKIKNLGMAQKQMVEIAKALSVKSKILILDEPTASLTQKEVDALFAIIRDLKQEGVGIVYISHRLEEIFTLCDRVTVIRDGRYISTRNVKDTNKDELVEDMVGRSMTNYYPKADVAIGDELLRVSNLFDNSLLRDVSFNVRKGEILGFAGLAGSGRTELAHAICGLSSRAGGEILLAGQRVNFPNYQSAMESGLVYVSEDRGKYGIILDMSIKDNIVMPQLKKNSKFSVINRESEASIAEKMRGDMGIKAPDTAFLAANLSGGNQQKVSVSKAIALDPLLLILDEPTRGVDVGAKAEIHKIISSMAASGLTILLISSELPELIGMCDRIYVMKDGTVAGCFDRDGFSQQSILSVALASAKEQEVSV